MCAIREEGRDEEAEKKGEGKREGERQEWIQQTLKLDWLSNGTYGHKKNSISPAQVTEKDHRIIESQNIPSWEGTVRVTESNSRLHTRPPKSHSACVRALSQCFLNDLYDIHCSEQSIWMYVINILPLSLLISFPSPCIFANLGVTLV